MGEDSGDTVINSPRAAERPSRPDVFDTVLPAAAAPEALEKVVAEALEGSARNPRSGGGSSAIYSFRIGGLAQPIPLDRPAYIGRRPSRPRIPKGLAPRLVRVVSPHQEVSATHLEIRQLGASVIVTDLRSTNGSVVLSPGSVPRKLRQGESVVVVPGTLVDIGDENILQILPLEHLAAAGSGRSS